MSTSESATSRPMSGLFTALAVILFLGGFYLAGSIFFASYAWYMRLGIVLVSLVASLVSLMMTDHWTRLRHLAKGARIEIRKVFWPSKDELLKTTLMVLVIVSVFAVFLTIVDALLALLIRMVL